METIVSRTLSVHKEHEVLLKLEAAGLNDELAQKVIDSKGNDLAAKVVTLIQNQEMFSAFEPSTSQKHARSIMGKNFFGVEEAIKHFGVNPSKQQLAYLAEVPFTVEVLKACKATHVLVAVFPMSILDIRGKVKRKLFYRHYDTWYNKQAFAKDKGEVGWQLVRKVPIADSALKTWNEQQALLENVEETPKAQVLVYTIIGHFLATGERLFENIYVRSSDHDWDGRRFGVGHFDAEGLHVYYWHDGSRNGYVGLSAAMKQ
ncbi:MAG: hypothetical protein Q8Q18_00365 [bacterium]|nr:hypothetical protein [bacterium]